MSRDAWIVFSAKAGRAFCHGYPGVLSSAVFTMAVRRPAERFGPRAALAALALLLAPGVPCWGVDQPQAPLSLEDRVRRLEHRLDAWRLPRISGYIQGQYDAQQKSVPGMRIRRTRLAFTHTITDSLDAEVEFALPKPDVNQALEYAFVTYGWTPWLSSRAGRFKVVFGLEEPMAMTKVPYVEKALLSDVLSHEIDQGIDISVRRPWINMSVAVVNGQNKNAETNNRKDGIGRIGVRPFAGAPWASAVEIGASGHHGLRREGSEDIGISRLGLDADWETDRFWLRAEWARGGGWNKLAARSSRSRGYQAFAVWKVHARWDLVAMYDRFEPDRDAVAETVFDPARNEVSRTTLGVTYFIDREKRALVRANYEFNREEEGPAVRNDAWRLQFQARW